jgi:hypothetical protein
MPLKRYVKWGEEVVKVVEVKHVEDCFDGSLIKEFLLSEEIRKDFIFVLGRNGTVQYLDSFARPFFKIRVKGTFDVKGIEGNTTMRVHLKNPDGFSIDDFMRLVEEY